MTKYAKALVAALGGVAQAVNAAALPATVKPWFGVVAALLTAAGVYQVKNADGAAHN